MLALSRPKQALLLLMLAAATAAWASREHVVVQRNKAFSVKKLSVKVGDTVKFLNEDSVVHNVFSLSPPKHFDLGLAGQGVAGSVVFDKPGTAEIECSIHPGMQLIIEVTP